MIACAWPASVRWDISELLPDVVTPASNERLRTDSLRFFTWVNVK